MASIKYHYAKEESVCVACGHKIVVGARFWLKLVANHRFSYDELCNPCGSAELRAFQKASGCRFVGVEAISCSTR